MNNKAVILIVDDEIKIVNALKRVLHKMDCEILSATSPEDAIKIIDQSNTILLFVITACRILTVSMC